MAYPSVYGQKLDRAAFAAPFKTRASVGCKVRSKGCAVLFYQTEFGFGLS
jgi:hypothetical protein